MVTDHINGIRGTSISNSSLDTTSNNNSSSTEVTISSISSKVIISSSSKAITRAATSKDPTGNNSMGRTEVMANSSTAGNSKEGISHREGMEEIAIIVVVRIREINTTADNKGSNTAAVRGVTSGL